MDTLRPKKAIELALTFLEISWLVVTVVPVPIPSWQHMDYWLVVTVRSNVVTVNNKDGVSIDIRSTLELPPLTPPWIPVTTSMTWNIFKQPGILKTFMAATGVDPSQSRFPHGVLRMMALAWGVHWAICRRTISGATWCEVVESKISDPNFVILDVTNEISYQV